MFPPSSCFRGDHYREDLHRASYHCRATNRLGTIFTRAVRVTAGKQVEGARDQRHKQLSNGTKLVGEVYILEVFFPLLPSLSAEQRQTKSFNLYNFCPVLIWRYLLYQGQWRLLRRWRRGVRSQ